MSNEDDNKPVGKKVAPAKGITLLVEIGRSQHLIEILDNGAENTRDVALVGTLKNRIVTELLKG